MFDYSFFIMINFQYAWFPNWSVKSWKYLTFKFNCCCLISFSFKKWAVRLGRVFACCSVVESKGDNHFSELASHISLSANAMHQFCWIERVACHRTVHPWKAGSVWPETSPSLSALLHLWTGWSRLWPVLVSTLI